MKEKEQQKSSKFDGNYRKETWIHPEGGSRVHRTAPLNPSINSTTINNDDNNGGNNESSDDEELHNMDPSELNKRFVISFLHVQGKLINNIGMETFQTCATQMLKEFRALLHISPIPVNSHRLLQLISMNMYAIANSQIKGEFSHDLDHICRCFFGAVLTYCGWFFVVVIVISRAKNRSLLFVSCNCR